MSGRSSRRKGADAENEVAKILRDHGFDGKRTSMTQTAGFGADITGLPGFFCEIKRQERISIVAWCEQAEAAAVRSDSPLDIPLVVWRSSRQPWRATLPFDDLLTILS